MIAWTAACALLCWGATVYMVRAVAQEGPPGTPPGTPPATATDPPSADVPDPAAAGAGEPDTNEDLPAGTERGAAPAAREELPEFRDSADNNTSLPVDI